jgi:hypothetical protein
VENVNKNKNLILYFNNLLNKKMKFKKTIFFGVALMLMLAFKTQATPPKDFVFDIKESSVKDNEIFTWRLKAVDQEIFAYRWKINDGDWSDWAELTNFNCDYGDSNCKANEGLGTVGSYKIEVKACSKAEMEDCTDAKLDTLEVTMSYADQTECGNYDGTRVDCYEKCPGQYQRFYHLNKKFVGSHFHNPPENVHTKHNWFTRQEDSEGNYIQNDFDIDSRNIALVTKFYCGSLDERTYKKGTNCGYDDWCKDKCPDGKYYESGEYFYCKKNPSESSDSSSPVERSDNQLSSANLPDNDSCSADSCENDCASGEFYYWDGQYEKKGPALARNHDTINYYCGSVSAQNSMPKASIPDTLIYRFSNPSTGKHLFTRDSNPGSIWKSEGVAFKIYEKSGLLINWNYDKDQNQWTKQFSKPFYLGGSAKEIGGISDLLHQGTPLYKFSHQNGDVVYATLSVERKALIADPNWTNDGIVGYVDGPVVDFGNNTLKPEGYCNGCVSGPFSSECYSYCSSIISQSPSNENDSNNSTSTNAGTLEQDQSCADVDNCEQNCANGKFYYTSSIRNEQGTPFISSPIPSNPQYFCGILPEDLKGPQHDIPNTTIHRWDTPGGNFFFDSNSSKNPGAEFTKNPNEAFVAYKDKGLDISKPDANENITVKSIGLYRVYNSEKDVYGYALESELNTFANQGFGESTLIGGVAPVLVSYAIEPLHRFRNNKTGAFILTVFNSEMQNLWSNAPDWIDAPKGDPFNQTKQTHVGFFANYSGPGIIAHVSGDRYK